MRYLTSLLLAGVLSVAASASAQANTALPSPIPAGVVLSSWSDGLIERQAGSLLLVDPIAGNHLAAPPWLRADPAGGFLLDGSQATDVRLRKKQSTSPNFTIGVDLNPSEHGIGDQTFITLYAFCELRYESAHGRLSFIVWPSGSAPAKTPRRDKFIIAQLPLSPGKWSRVVAEVAGDRVRLTVNETTTETAITESWDLIASEVPVMFGNASGGTRPFLGRFNHLYFATQP